MGWPQITILVLVFLEFVGALSKHGEPRPPYNAGLTLLGSGILLVVLWWGGFFA